MVREYTNVLVARSSIPGRVIPKMVSDAALLNTLFGVVAIEKETFESPSIMVANLLLNRVVKKSPTPFP